MSETTLFFTLAGQTLRDRCRWAAITLLLTPLIPYEVVDNRPQFLWQLVRELPLAGIVAALAPLAAGIVLLIASYAARRSTSLAIIVLASLSTAAALIQLGADAAAWGLLKLPDDVIEHPASAILALALTAAGANLAQKPQCRPFARRALAAAAALVLLYYIMPGRGRAPGVEAVRLLAAIVQASYWRVKIAFVLLSTIALAPAILVSVGARSVLRAPSPGKPLIGALAVYTLPAITIVLLYRSFFGAVPGAEILGAVGAAVLLAAVLAILASSFEVLGEASVTPDAELALPSGFALRRAVLVAGGVSAFVCVGQGALARPPSKGIEWTLREPSAAATDLFGALIPAWNDARKARDASLDAAAASMVDAARAIEPGLGRAIERLAKDGVELHVAGRRFYTLISDVNEASRAAGLPYYLDPTIAFGKDGDGLVRRFNVHAYRVDAAHTVHVGERPFTALHVRSIGGMGGGPSALGFSRDIQAFALINLDEIDPLVKAITEPPIASAPRMCGASSDAHVASALEECERAMTSFKESAPESVRREIVAITERHELQHQIDGPHLPIAAAVERRLMGQSRALVDRVNRELSAYVAAPTTESATPMIGMVQLLRFAILSRHGAEHYVALIAFEALAADDGALREKVRRGDVDSIRDVFMELSSLDESSLRARAASAWRELFRQDLARPL